MIIEEKFETISNFFLKCNRNEVFILLVSLEHDIKTIEDKKDLETYQHLISKLNQALYPGPLP